MISLATLCQLNGAEALRRAFADDERLNRRALLPYLDQDFRNGMITLWLVIEAYPKVVPKRWFTDGSMVGVKISVAANSATVTSTSAPSASLVTEIEVIGFSIEDQMIELRTPLAQVSMDVNSVQIEAFLPLGGGDYGLEHVGRQIGKF